MTGPAPGAGRGHGPRGRPVVVARLDNAGDVLLAGPAVRAVAAERPVLLVHGPTGAEAAALLPGVAERLELDAPWIAARPGPVDRAALDAFVEAVRRRGPVAAAVLTSSHQSPLPTALLLRLAGVERIAAVSADYGGSLLDHRIPGDPDLHEVARALAVVAELGHRLPEADDGRLAVRRPLRPAPPGPYVVVHPGCSVPARTLDPDRWADAVAALAADGRRVLVTGAAHEAELTRRVAGRAGEPVEPADLAGLAAVLAAADAVACGNTGPAHLAAAVGTPVTVVHPPTVPSNRWHPWGVAHLVLGDQGVGCAGCRARACPVRGQPCLGAVDGRAVADAVAWLVDGRGTAGRAAPPAEVPA